MNIFILLIRVNKYLYTMNIFPVHWPQTGAGSTEKAENRKIEHSSTIAVFLIVQVLRN